MIVAETIEDLRAACSTLHGKIGLVPTMGYLHAGHLSLVEAARNSCTSVVATLFVNPTQFSEGEDLQAYPRDVDRDLALFENAGVDIVFLPTPEIMYPSGFQTWVSVEEVSQGKEGGRRPGHFRGVATVVAKLFNLVQPDIAFFGQKDAQQVAVIRQLVRDLNFPIEIQVCPIIREEDGLALSSRNVYLSVPERTAATVISRALSSAAKCYDDGERDPDVLRSHVIRMLHEEPLADVEYVSLADAATLKEVYAATEQPLLLSLVVRIGRPHLLDNCLLPQSLNSQQGATATLAIG